MIRTVTGDISIEESGNVLMHEHIMCSSNDLRRAFGDNWLDENELCDRATEVLLAAKKEFGLGIFVDGTPCDLGRNAELLRKISERSGVHIIASTGLYFFPSMISFERSADEIYRLLMQETVGGLDGTDIKPGILKCAIDSEGMTSDTKKRLTAIGKIQAETGLSLYAHCAHRDNTAFELIDLLSECGAEPKKLVIGHVSRRLNADYLKRVLDRGVYICIDQSFAGSEQGVAQVVYELCRAGYEKNLLFSHDRSIRNDFIADCRSEYELSIETNIKRYSYLYELLIPALKKEGCTERQCELFLRENSLRVLDI